MPTVRFEAIYQQRVWGGRKLASALGRALPEPDVPFGEAWEIVDRPEANSSILSGPHAGKTLRAALEADATSLMGPAWDAAKPFPLLVKWLDCRERLSLQVHPPASVAPSLGGEPKTENWFIAEADKQAALIVGLKRGIDRPAFENALQEGTLEDCLHRFAVRAGQSIFVPSGRLHAIDAGNLILEIQQNSDTTYRVYDWGRVGLDGQPRQLHVEQSLQSIDWDDAEPKAVTTGTGETTLAECPHFRLRYQLIGPGRTLHFPPSEQPILLSIIDGRLKDTDTHETLQRGENVLVPFATGGAFTASAPAAVIVTDHFVN
ncbi:MAG: type I phosphomannose isomerase catalytic subunit [Opitutales bacterium]